MANLETHKDGKVLFYSLDLLLSDIVFVVSLHFDIVELMMGWTGVQAALLVIIQLCQRNSGRMDEAQREVTHTKK